ncbi:hypothetical protein DMI62_09690 [Escherichia coli]|nr:hypothetical protein [Escherichia coli]
MKVRRALHPAYPFSRVMACSEKRMPVLKVNVINVLMLSCPKCLKSGLNGQNSCIIKHAFVRDESAEGRGRAGVLLSCCQSTRGESA